MSDTETVNHLIEQLDLHKIDKSKEIVQKIVACGNIAIVPLFEAFYYTDKSGEKEYILDAIAQLIERDRLVEHLLNIIDRLHGFARYYSLKYLLDIGSKTVHHQLIPIMVESISSHYYLDQIAREKLPHLGDVAMKQLIAELNKQSQLQTNEYDSRLWHLVSALSLFDDDKIVKPIIDALKSIQNEQMYQMFPQTFENIGVKAVPNLIEIVQDSASNYSLKLCIVHILARIGDKQSAESLLPLLTHDEEEMRSFVAYALGDIHNNTVIPNLIELLKADPHEYVRIASANALGEMRDDGAISPLIETLKTDKSEDVRRTAAGSLKYYKGSEVVTALVQALHDEEAGVAIMAGYALSNKLNDARPQLKALHKQKPELIDRAFNTWKWEFIDSCRNNKELQKTSLGSEESISSVIEYYSDQSHDCPICGKSPADLTWFYLSTGQETWRMLMGRAGWQSICDDCHLQVDFFLTSMN